jgi:hypothetical protein
MHLCCELCLKQYHSSLETSAPALSTIRTPPCVGSTSREAALCRGAASLKILQITERRRRARSLPWRAHDAGLPKIVEMRGGEGEPARRRGATLPLRQDAAAGAFDRIGKVLFFLGHLPLLPLRRRGTLPPAIRIF